MNWDFCLSKEDDRNPNPNHEKHDMDLILRIVPRVSHFIMVLNNHYKILTIKFFAGKYLPHFHELCVQDIPT